MHFTAVSTLCVVIVSAAELTSGAVMHEDLKTEEVYGRIVKYCEHGGLRYLRGSRFKDYDNCSTCTCDKTGLTCYTMFPVITEPEDSECTYMIVGCRVRWVLKRNNQRRCPEHLIPDQFF
ncbi:hypothetical protein ACF0H5_014007 [Mactra antiquata]